MVTALLMVTIAWNVTQCVRQLEFMDEGLVHEFQYQYRVWLNFG